MVHICFGSFRRLPYAKRTYRWLFPALLDANVHGFWLEFGAREMAEIDLVGKWDSDRILSAGLIDIKTHYCETPEDIIERVTRLPGVPRSGTSWRSPPTAACAGFPAIWR